MKQVQTIIPKCEKLFFSKEVKAKQEAATRKSIETSNHPEKNN